MIKKKLCKLITTGLIVTMLIGSVGTTVSAAEADAASTDLIMLEEDEENGEDKHCCCPHKEKTDKTRVYLSEMEYSKEREWNIL